MRRRRRLFVAAAGAVLVLSGCSVAGDLREDRAAVEARTCASLVERITGRALQHGRTDDDDTRDGEKPALSPRLLVDDPEAFYAELAERVTPERFSHGDEARGSSASRLTQRCRALGR